MSAGAPIGNQNAAKGKAYEGAIKRALARKAGSVEEGLNLIAMQLVNDAIEAEDAATREKARKEIGDRIDGKPKQQLDVAGDLGVAVNWPVPKGKLG